jgi:hypothetical protein
MLEKLQKVDHASLKSNQGMIILLLVLAFIFNTPYLAAFVALVMLFGTLFGRPGFFLVYRHLLVPVGLIEPDLVDDNPEPHRFAQGFGASVLIAASIFLLLNRSTLGWVFVWVVLGLAMLNLLIGFCAGCAVYYWLNKLKVPGFRKAPPPGTFPGLRPK